jgi:proliferating cell nuclear antigen
VKLKDILLETNIVILKRWYENYKYRQITYNINIQCKPTILAHLYLPAKTFAFYECQCERITIGVNMFYLFKLINTIDNDNTLPMYIEEQ